MKRNNIDFQTPPPVADYMAAKLYPYIRVSKYYSILEPTAGAGNLVTAVKKLLSANDVNDYCQPSIITPKDFWKVKDGSRFNCAIMNPPFSPMAEGMRYLAAVMDMTDNIVALLPWFILINSERRLKIITDYGLVSVTHLPRKTFPDTRIQCCVLHMVKGYEGKTTFEHFEF